MTRKFAFMTCVLAIALAGCAALSGTPYGPNSLINGGGYGDYERGQGRWEVRFAANVGSLKGYAAQAALYRAAEVAEAHGFAYFKVVNQETTKLGGGGGGGTASGGTVYTYSATDTGEMTVLFFVGLQAKDTPVPCEAADPKVCAVFEPKQVLADYGPSIQAKTLRPE